MKKFFSMMAIAIACVAFTSCEPKMAFEKQVNDMLTAMQASDFDKAQACADEIMAGKDKATVDELVTVAQAYIGITSDFSNKAQQAGELESQEVKEKQAALLAKIVDAIESAKAKDADRYAKCVASAKESNPEMDLDMLLPMYKQSLEVLSAAPAVEAVEEVADSAAVEVAEEAAETVEEVAE